MKKAQEFSQIAQANALKISANTQSTYDSYLDRLHAGSLAKFNSFIKRFEELAKQGYGAVEIKLDNSTDFFQVESPDGRFYSANEVKMMLTREEFELRFVEDHYDAQSYIVTWNKGLPCSSDKIGMSI